MNELKSKKTIQIIENQPYSWKNISLWDFLSEGNIPSGWNEFFEKKEVQKELYNISNELKKVKRQIFPPIQQVFRAFYLTPLNKLKAVIIGQDPYHNGTSEKDCSAVGLCFSVRKGNSINSSLKNIYKELKNEGFKPNMNGNLTHIAKQGILLINMSLTVEKASPDSHSLLWYNFSLLCMKYIEEKCGNNIHWLLFGKNAHNIMKTVSTGKFHCTSHPSGYSANKPSGGYPAFIGSNVFLNVRGIHW